MSELQDISERLAPRLPRACIPAAPLLLPTGSCHLRSRLLRLPLRMRFTIRAHSARLTPCSHAVETYASGAPKQRKRKAPAEEAPAEEEAAEEEAEPAKKAKADDDE